MKGYVISIMTSDDLNKSYYSGVISPWEQKELAANHGPFILLAEYGKTFKDVKSAAIFHNEFEAEVEINLVKMLMNVSRRLTPSLKNRREFTFKIEKVKVEEIPEYDFEKTVENFMGIRKGIVDFVKQYPKDDC